MRTMKKTVAAWLALLLICALVTACGTGGRGDGDGAPATPEIPENARISYLGPAGTYTEEAAKFFFATGTFQPKETVQDAIADVTDGAADYAVIPQENTLGGAVTNYVDALIAQQEIYVVGEVILPINQTLMGVPGASLEDIRTVCSHAQGLAQSAAWRTEHLPDAATEEMASTAAAASYVAETGDKTIAAIAAPARRSCTAFRFWLRMCRSRTRTKPGFTSCPRRRWRGPMAFLWQAVRRTGSMTSSWRSTMPARSW